MDLGLVAGVTGRLGGGADARGPAERIALGARLLMPLLQGAEVGNTQLAKDLRTALASREAVTLVVPPGASPGALRIEIGTRQFALPPALREALLAALAQAGSAATPSSSSAANPAGAASAAPVAAAPAALLAEPARAWAVAAQTTAAAAGVISGSGAPRSVQRSRDDAPAAAVRFQQPLFEPVRETLPVQAAADRMRHAIERSGLFFESHVAQWADGGRDLAEMRAELLRAAPAVQGELSSQRVAAQVALLQDGALRIDGPAWPGQPMSLAVRRDDTAAEGASAAEPVFSATLKLDLPALGAVQVQLRMAGSAISARVESEAEPTAQAARAALGELAERLQSQGLRPVLMHAAQAASQSEDEVGAATPEPAAAITASEAG